MFPIPLFRSISFRSRSVQQVRDRSRSETKVTRGPPSSERDEGGNHDDQRGNEGVTYARGRDWRRYLVDGMVAGAAESSAKRAKVDEADEEEDPLVRRKEEVVRLLGRARAKGKGNARAKKELLTLCADFEAKNEKLLRRLPPELWEKIVDENVQQNDLLALAMTCRFFREKLKDLGRKVETNLKAKCLLELRKSGKVASHSLGWFQWVCDTFKVLPRFTMGTLINYAALQGSVEILRWLMEDKGWEPNLYTVGEWAGFGGSVEVLEYLLERGYAFRRGKACEAAARGGCLEALKFLRGLDPPCPWSKSTCEGAARRGHLDVLKWLRAQEPPCPWSTPTCTYAAERGHLEVLKWLRAQNPPCPWDGWTCTYPAEVGHLEVLKWVRDQDPPCPWSEITCAYAAYGGHLDVLKWLRAQEPPCPWSTSTCTYAAEGGHLEVLKWARSQDPPCPWSSPWSRRECRELALQYGHRHIIDWFDQQEDESDVE